MQRNTHTVNNKEKIFSSIFVLHILIFILSINGVFSKFASQTKFLSFNFIALYGLTLFNLAVYAIAWQQFLKHFSLSTAFCNKSATIIWGMIWGALIFHEVITWNMIVGAAIVILGVIMVVKSDE